MTEEELTELVNGCNPRKLTDAMEGLDEPGRKRLAKKAIALLREATRDDSTDYSKYARRKSMAELAVLGLCRWSAAKRAKPSLFAFNDKTDWVSLVLQVRKPEWIDQWVQGELDQRFVNWHSIRNLVRGGVCQRPTDDQYIIRMINHRAGEYGYRETPLADVMREDRELLGFEVWRIFEIDLGRQIVFENDTDLGANMSWTVALVELSRTGDLDRGRLLTESLLGAAGHQQQQLNASWFCRFHEALEPTPEERYERQNLYHDLVQNRVPTVVGFAIDALRSIAAEGKLNTDHLVAAMPQMLAMRQKTHALAAVRLMRQAGKQSPAHAAAIAAQAVCGLGHPSVEVQKGCVELMRTLAMGADPALAEAIASRIDDVAPSLREGVNEILAKVSQGTAESSRATPRDQSVALPMQGEIDSIAPRWRELAGVDRSLRALSEGRELPPLNFDSMSVPRLDPSALLTPIADLDELIERASTAVEKLEDADEFELLIDAISRFCDRRPIDLQIRTAPLVKRIGDLFGEDRWAVNALEVQTRFRRLVRAWLVRESMGPVPGTPGILRPIEFISRRLEKLSIRLLSGKAGPLLACPTHRGGWLDPRELVWRVRYWQDYQREANRPIGLYSEHSSPDVFDLIQAILRLAPDHRDEALAQAADLEGEGGAVVRFAIGGDESIGRNAGLWIAAHRAREPRGTFPELARHWPDLGPDGAEPAKFGWQATAYVTVSPPVLPANSRIDRPLALMADPASDLWGMSTIANIRARAAIWPANPESCFADGANNLITRLNSAASTFSPLSPYLEPLFDPDIPFGEMAQLALAIALISKDAGARTLGVDALIEIVSDGRCTGNELGEVFGKLGQAKGVLRFHRLVESLHETSRASALHLDTVTRIAQRTVASIGEALPKDLYHLLSPLREWLIATDQPVTPECRLRLATINGSGKSASLASAILKVNPTGESAIHLAALSQGCLARIVRARRWFDRMQARR